MPTDKILHSAWWAWETLPPSSCLLKTLYAQEIHHYEEQHPTIAYFYPYGMLRRVIFLRPKPGTG